MICSVKDPFELWDIISGEIRYFDVYYRGDDGLWKVKNRVDRIVGVLKLLEKKRMKPVYGHKKRKTTYGPGFKTDLLPDLLPERLDFLKLELLFFSLYNMKYFFNSTIRNKLFIKIE